MSYLPKQLDSVHFQTQTYSVSSAVQLCADSIFTEVDAPPEIWQGIYLEGFHAAASVWQHHSPPPEQRHRSEATNNVNESTISNTFINHTYNWLYLEDVALRIFSFSFERVSCYLWASGSPPVCNYCVFFAVKKAVYWNSLAKHFWNWTILFGYQSSNNHQDILLHYNLDSKKDQPSAPFTQHHASTFTHMPLF